MAKRLKEAHVIGGGVYDVHEVTVLGFDHQFGMVAEPLGWIDISIAVSYIWCGYTYI